ncbi:MAG: hypothetical protein ACPLWB_06800 [Caldisericia bacterium]
MDDKLKILGKLIEKRNDGIPKSEFGKSKKILNILDELLKNDFIKELKIKKRIFLFITEKGESEFIKKINYDEKLEIINQNIINIKSEIKKLTETLNYLCDLINNVKPEKNIKNLKEIDIESEIFLIYKELSKKSYSYLGGLVPIPSITVYLVKKYNLKESDVHKSIYELYNKGKVSFEMGDKKTGNLETPDGKKYYYLRFKEWKSGNQF